MTLVHDVVAYLREIGETTIPIRDVAGTAIIHGLRNDRAAGPGEMSWLSPKHMAEVDARLKTFGGALVLYPVDAQVSADYRSAVPCRNPKYAFSRVVQSLMPELLGTQWLPALEWQAAERTSNARLASGVVLSDDTLLGPGISIGPNSCIAHAVIGRGVIIGANCTIGQPGFGFERGPDGHWVRFPHVGRVVIEEDVEIGNNVCIDRGALGDTIIRRGSKIDNLVHIAHNVEVGADAMVIANAMIAGSVRVETGAWIAPSASVLNQLTIGAGAIVGMGATVIRDVDPGVTVVGNPAKPLRSVPSHSDQILSDRA